jgi:hypothetical protein
MIKDRDYGGRHELNAFYKGGVCRIGDGVRRGGGQKCAADGAAPAAAMVRLRKVLGNAICFTVF